MTAFPSSIVVNQFLFIIHSLLNAQQPMVTFVTLYHDVPCTIRMSHRIRVRHRTRTSYRFTMSHRIKMRCCIKMGSLKRNASRTAATVIIIGCGITPWRWKLFLQKMKHFAPLDTQCPRLRNSAHSNWRIERRKKLQFRNILKWSSCSLSRTEIDRSHEWYTNMVTATGWTAGTDPLCPSRKPKPLNTPPPSATA